MNDVEKSQDLYYESKIDFLTNPFSTSRTKIENFSKPDVVLIQCPGWGVETPPLSLASLAAFSRQHGFKTLPVDLNIEHFVQRQPRYSNVWSIDHSQSFWNNTSFVEEYARENEACITSHINAIVQTGTKLVAFSIYQSSMEMSLIYARLLKDKNPAIKIIFGGPHASLNMAGTHIINRPYVDGIAQGEGELIFTETIAKVKYNDSLADIRGLITKKDGNIVNPGPRGSIKNLGMLPFADFSDYDFFRYAFPKKLPLMSSRGCPNQCIYCSEVVYWETFRGYGAARVVDEIQHHLREYPFLDRVEFQDSLVNGHIPRLEQFADEIIKRGLKFIWAGQAVIRKEMTYPLFKKLKESGCECLAFGLETSSVGLMTNIGKSLARNTDVDQLVQDAHDAGLSCAYNFMFGMPGETEDDAKESLAFLKKHHKKIGTVNPSAAFCGFTPGTPGFDTPEKFGIVPSPTQGQYWTTEDGKNDLLVRLERFEKFCSLAMALNVHTTYPHAKLLDRDRVIGSFYYFHQDYQKAAEHFDLWLEEHSSDEEIKYYRSECERKILETPPSLMNRLLGLSSPKRPNK
jgi:radical SAM superfamily enzyme YgiQ (UPF0313 family)